MFTYDRLLFLIDHLIWAILIIVFVFLPYIEKILQLTDLSLLFLIVFAQANAKGAPPETLIIEKFLIFSLFAISKTILGQSSILKFETGSDIPYPGLSNAIMKHFSFFKGIFFNSNLDPGHP